MVHRKKQTKFKVLEKKVNKMTKNFETKHVDVVKTSTELSFDVNHATALFLPAQGIKHNERVGDSASPFRLNAKIYIKNTDSSVQPHSVRIMIIQSKQRYTPSTITTSGVTQLFATAAVEDVTTSNLVHDNRSHYVLLHDRTYDLESDEGKVINISKKISRQVEFEPAVTTTEAGQIWLCATSDLAVAAAGPLIRYSTRVMYKDA